MSVTAILPKMAIEQSKRRAVPTPPSHPSHASSHASSSKTSEGKRQQRPQSHKTTATTTKTQSSQNSREAVPGKQPHGALDAAAILNNPRLRQVTGLQTRKSGWWSNVKPPKEELARLQWVMSLPDTYPTKRPKGNY
ncbi:hypothetical protein F5B20DRAFT_224370 [Whalleya microplaca]|nr:hypothetical protein F5B20DRAFT_224370 [Whalleya microplaca]